jgi:hypothetical protein
VGLSFSYLAYDWLPPNKEKILGGGSTDIYSEIVVSQLISSFGRLEGIAQAARARLVAESAALRRAQQTVSFNARASYHALRYAHAAVGYYVEAEKQMQYHLKIAQGLVEAGKAAGAMTCLVTNGRPGEERTADFTVDTPGEVVATLKELIGRQDDNLVGRMQNDVFPSGDKG